MAVCHGVGLEHDADTVFRVSPELTWLLELKKQLNEARQREIGIAAGTVHKATLDAIASHPPETKAESLERAEHFVGGLTIVYVLAIEESVADDVGITSSQRDQIWQSALPSDDYSALRALRHVRNTVAHGHGGKRARTDYVEFDQVAPTWVGNLVVRYDADEIVLNAIAGYRASELLDALINVALNKVPA